MGKSFEIFIRSILWVNVWYFHDIDTVGKSLVFFHELDRYVGKIYGIVLWVKSGDTVGKSLVFHKPHTVLKV